MQESSDSGLHFRPLPRIGQELGRFIIEKELPRGGQARVYRAWQTDLQRPVALKLLPGSFTADEDASARFKREIENVARINHPNVVRVFEAGEIESHPYFTMEFLEGHDAETMIKRGPVDTDEAASIIEAIARGVHYAHKSGIVHRDIKPGNIILRGDDTPVLTDFGLAQDLTHSAQLTRTGISMGTPAYMSPEQARGERNRVGVKSDIYALGATLFSLLTGKRPVEGESAYELMVKVAESEGPRWPRQAIEDVPADLRAIVEMAMQNDPGKRYDSAEGFAEDLERYLHGDWVVARSRSPLAKLWARTRRYVPVAGVIVVALALAGGMIYTGLNPYDSANTESPILGEEENLLGNVTDKVGGDPEEEFSDEGRWTKSGAQVSRGPGGEFVLARGGDEPIRISTRSPICWGDFSVVSDFRVDDTDGPLEFHVGMPSDGRAEDTGYSIVLGAVSRDRYELRRLGAGVTSAYRPDGAPLLQDNTWYRTEINRSGETIDFTLSQVATGLVVVSFKYADEYPALINGYGADGAFRRQHFGILAHAGELSVRNVTVTHRDNQRSTEALLFSVGQFAEAELRLSARLTEPLPDDAGSEERNARAEMLYLRARCRVKLEDFESARADATAAKFLVSSPELRARVFLLGSRLETESGDDTAALVQLRVAQTNSTPSGTFTSHIFHDAYLRGRELEQTEPWRAVRYYDFVATNALGRPWLICDSLYRSSELLLAAAPANPEDEISNRERAIDALERIESASYQRFGSTFAPAMASLFRLRYQGLLAGRDDAGVAPLAEAAGLLEDSVDAYGVDNRVLVNPLVRASWAGRMGADSANPRMQDLARDWLQGASRAGGDPIMVAFLSALMSHERPADPEGRVVLWRELADRLDVEEEAHAPLAAVADYFLGIPVDADDMQRRNDLLRRTLRRDIEHIAPEWRGDMDADRFADYCIALYTAPVNRDAAVETLESASTAAGAGVLGLLQGRAGAWLPIPG